MLIFESVLLFLVIQSTNAANELKRLQLNHRFHRLSNGQIKQLANRSNIQHFNTVLDKILIPRVASTKNHEKVFQFIKSELLKFGWHVEVDEFEDDTPNFGRLKFKNIIGTLNPNADRYLVLACHYDSKYFQNEVFVGAIDSAVPCAMMLNLIAVLRNEMISLKNQTAFNLKLIFFDGEEAFKDWGPKDSIYGARHLAYLYGRTQHRLQSTDEIVNDLEKIDILILLDLLGHAHVNFYNFFPETTRWYSKMGDIEEKLQSMNLFRSKRTQYFVGRDFFNSRIEDDHIPFLKKNVPILHLIPIPFPPEWHTVNDNHDIVDINAVENLNKILRIFVVQYLHIYLSDGQEDSIPEKEL